ncbi:MAG: hypothetical protein PHV18_05135 [Lachnospiraceae bacterium]|nr:hypothetical protein [Lachnospiraceae bacterium]
MGIAVERVEITPNPVFTSKNLIGEQFYKGFIHLTTGNFQKQEDSPYPDSLYGDPFPVRKGKNYIASGFSEDFRYRLFNPDGSYYGSVGSGKSLKDCPADGYVIPLFYAGLKETEKATVQIEEGGTATVYSAPVQFKIAVTIVTHEFLGRSTYRDLKSYTYGQLKDRGYEK